MPRPPSWPDRIYTADKAAAAYRLSARVLGRGRDAEECAEEALARVWKAGLRHPDKRDTYLTPRVFGAIVLRLALSQRERRDRNHGAVTGLPADAGAPRGRLLPVLEGLAIWDALDRLTSLRRKVMLLTIGGHDDLEISRLLGRSPAAVRNARFHARKALQEDLS